MHKKPVFKKVIDFEEAKQLIEQIRWDRGCSSGYKDLDNLCGGLVQNGVTLIGGRPAMGKTSLALNIVSRMAQQREGTILVFSPTMRSDAIVIRLFSIAMGLEAEDFLNNKVPPATVAARFRDYYETKECGIRINWGSYLSLDDIWDCCRKVPDLRLVVVDPVNAICKPTDFSAGYAKWDEKEDPNVVFRSLQALAQYCNVPVLCTTQLHRSLERRKNKRPRLGDLKKVGIPAELADQIIFLYRDQYYDPEGEDGAEWIVAKAAQGNVGTLRLDWDYATMRFTERSFSE